MGLNLTRISFAIAAVLATSAAQALSISATPATQNASPGGQATVTLSFDLGADTSIGGGMLVDFSGPLSNLVFTPSAFFTSLNTSADDTDFTGFGTNNKPADAEFEIHFGTFNGFSGANTIGTLRFDVTGSGTGLIALSASPSNNYGGFLNLVGDPLPTTFNNAEISSGAAVPLPATAWLFATGFGLAGYWRRRRA